MVKFNFSLARKQVILSIALILCTLLPLGIFIYEESVDNILDAYSQSIESSLQNAENRIVQDWREQNVIRSLHMEKIKKILLNMSVFTANYIDYLVDSGQQLRNVHREKNLSIASNIYFYIFDENGDLFAQNVTENARDVYSLGDVTPLSMQELDTVLINSNNSLFYVFEADSVDDISVLAHIQKNIDKNFYIVTTYNLASYNLEIEYAPEFLYEILLENVDYDELLEGGFFFAYDTYNNILLTQSKTDIAIPHNLIQDVIHSDEAESFFITNFSSEGENYVSHMRYLRKEHILLAAVFNKEQIVKSTNESMQSLVYLILLILCIGSLLAFYFGKTLMRPLASLRNMAEKIPHLDFNGTPQVMEGLPLNRHDEIGDLARTFSQIQGLLYENVSNLVEVQGKNERINAELNAARDMQMGLLPTNFPVFSYKNSYNLNAVCIPAREVGGDLYDFFMVDEDHLCFYIGDVSGKGMSAAFFMSIASTLIQVNMQQLKNVKLAMELLNEQLCRRNPESLFLTLFLATYNIHTGEVKYSSAGHLPALILDKTSHKYERVKDPNFILGLMTDMTYEEHTFQMEHNQLLYIYTDGITEAINDKRDGEDKFYGEERLEKSLALLCEDLFQNSTEGDSKESAQVDILKHIIKTHIDEIYVFCDGTQQADDITCLALYRP